MELKKYIHKISIMMVLIIFMSSNLIFAGGTRFSLKKGIYKKDKVWKIKFNTDIKKESLSKVGVSRDFYGKESIEGVSISLNSKDKGEILVNPPENGYEGGDYYIIIQEGLESVNDKFNPLTDKIIYKFHVESNELESINTEKILFKHYEVEDKLRESSTWINNNKDKKEYALAEEINDKNQENLKAIVDIWNLEFLEGNSLKGLINRYKKPNRTMYNKGGQVLNWEFYKDVEENRNINNVKEANKVRFGIVVTRSDVKGFPTETEYHKIKNDQFDRIQETAFEAGEGVAILHESKDGKWIFVQGYNYYGWVLKGNIAVGIKADIKEFVTAEDFIVILEDRVKLENDKMDYFYSMGAKLPIEYIGNEKKDFIVKVPMSNKDGELEIQNSFVGDIDYSIGYIKLTRENIIKQALKLQGTEYSWGDKGIGRDCSSTMMGIYKTMGINLPRNTDEQEDSYGGSINLIGKGRDSRYDKVKELETGDLLFLKGHEVMYLGKFEGRDYIVHNFTGATMKNGKTSRYEEVYRVGITPIDMLSGSGSNYIDLYTSFLKILK